VIETGNPVTPASGVPASEGTADTGARAQIDEAIVRDCIKAKG